MTSTWSGRAVAPGTRAPNTAVCLANLVCGGWAAVRRDGATEPCADLEHVGVRPAPGAYGVRSPPQLDSAKCRFYYIALRRGTSEETVGFIPAEDPGTDSGAAASRNLDVVCRLCSQLCATRATSPDVRYMLNGHQSFVGQPLASGSPSWSQQWPQWQFSTV